MNYLKHYNILMERSRDRVLEGYVEKHHIIPRCLGGTNDTTNIAVLTPEEHFLAHQLLVKIYPNSPPLVNAAVIMTTHHTEHRANNKLFGWLRRRASAYRKEWLKENGHPKGFLGKNHKLEDIDRITVGLKEYTTEKRIPIYAYNLDGTLYKKYESMIECAEDLKTNASNVKYTAEGKFTHCKGKQIRYDYVESMPPRTSRLAGVKKYDYVCPHCNKEGRGPAMKRFHFDRCKMKKETV
jgi:hypothetical protein